MSSASGRFFRDPLNVIALLIGAALSWLAVLGRSIGDFGVETDFFGEFVPAARHWMHGQPVPSGFRGPFYPLVLGGIGAITRDLFVTGKLLSAVSSALVLRLVGGLLRRLWGPTVAWCGTLFLVANPHFPFYALRACTDPVFFALFLSSLTLLLRERPLARDWAWAGALAGMAWLTRYNGAALLAAATILAMLLVRPGSRGIRLLACFAGAWVVVALPWALYLWRATGNPFWNLNYQNIATDVYAELPGVATLGRMQEFVGFQSMRDVWGVDPGRFLRAMGTNLAVHLKNDVLTLVGPVWAGVALVGLATALRRRPDRRQLGFAASGIVTYLALVPVFYNPRFMMPLLVWWAAAVGMAGNFFSDRLAALGGQRGHRGQAGRARPARSSPAQARLPWGRVAVISLVAGSALFMLGREIRDSQNAADLADGPPIELVGLAREARNAGLAIGPKTPIAARKPHIGYLLDAPVVNIPFGSIAELRDAGAHYLLVSGMESGHFAALAPLVWLADPTRPPEGLRLVARHAAPIGTTQARLASLYAVSDPLPWNPPVPRANRPALPPLAGLSHLESLRFRLARWYLAWEPRQPMESLLDRLSPQARELPAVLQLSGDIAMYHGDLDRSEALYRRSLDREPEDRAALLRLACVSYLREDMAGFDQTMRRFTAVAQLDSANVRQWWDIALEFGKVGQQAPAIPPFVICRLRDPHEPAVVEQLAVALKAMGRPDRAERLCTEFLAGHPGNPQLEKLAADIRQQRIAEAIASDGRVRKTRTSDGR